MGETGHALGSRKLNRISRFDISASSIGFDLNTRLLRPGLVESICRAHMRSEYPMVIVGLWSFSCMTLRIGFDLTQCACAHDVSNRLIIPHSDYQDVCFLLLIYQSSVNYNLRSYYCYQSYLLPQCFIITFYYRSPIVSLQMVFKRPYLLFIFLLRLSISTQFLLFLLSSADRRISSRCSNASLQNRLSRRHSRPSNTIRWSARSTADDLPCSQFVERPGNERKRSGEISPAGKVPYDPGVCRGEDRVWILSADG